MIMFDTDTVFSYIGYAAGLATVLAFAIQTIRILRTKSISGLSSYIYTMYCLGLICWASYGVYIESWVLVISNFVTFLFTFSILLLILYYDEEDKVERLRRDPLTYVFNKKYYEEVVPVKIVESQVAKKPFAIIVASVNNLEHIHQKMGGKYKNRALKQTARTLEKALRDSDFIARIDDNKFAIYLSNSDEKIAKTVLKRVVESVHAVEIKKSNDLSEKLELLVGICSSKQAENLADLTQKADEALSQAVYKGQSMIKVYSAKK